jgi:hypothetical protein
MLGSQKRAVKRLDKKAGAKAKGFIFTKTSLGLSSQIIIEEMTLPVELLFTLIRWKILLRVSSLDSLNCDPLTPLV